MNISLERLNYNLFKKNYTNWKISSVPGTFIDLSDKKIELPTISSLHLCNDFLTNGDTENIYPNLDIPLIEHEHFQKYLSFLINPISETTTPFGMYKTKCIFRDNTLRMKCLKYQTGLKGFKKVLNKSSIIGLKNGLIIQDYTRFLQVKFPGSLKYYLKFEFLLRTMLNNIVNDTSNRHHFIKLPLSNNTYTKSIYVKNFNTISLGTLMGIRDFSFYLEVQLLGFIYTHTKQLTNIKPFIWDTAPNIDQSVISSTSLFSRLDDSVLSRLNLILYVGDKAVIYNLQQIKEFASKTIFTNMVISQFFRLKGFDVTDDDLSEESDGKIVNDNRFKQSETKEPELENKDSFEKSDNSEVVDEQYNTNETKDTSYTQQYTRLTQANVVAEKSVSFYKQTEDKEFVEEEDVIDNDDTLLKDLTENNINFIDTDEDDVNSDDDVSDLNAAYIDSNIQPKIVSKTIQTYKYESITLPVQYPQVPQLKELKEDVNTYLSTLPDLKSTDLKRVDKLIAKQLSLKVGNDGVSNLLMEQTPKLKPKQITGLKDDPTLEDSSKESTIMNYDEQYMTEMFKSDIIKNVASLNKQGMFINDIEVNSLDDDFNSINEYKIKFVDVYGKSHNVKFKIPKVDSDGTMLVNGIKSVMVKQVVNVPICKISEYRVELISNYNKTVLTRTQSVVNTYKNYIDRYMSELINLKLIDVVYGVGKSDNSQELPYEYAIFKKKYKQISFNQYLFNFDYDNRYKQHVDTANYIKQLEQKYGVFCGYTTNKEYLFWSSSDDVVVYNRDTDTTISGKFTSLLNSLFKDQVALPKVCREYTELKIQDKVFPVIFIIAFRYGLSQIIKDLNITTRFYPSGKRAKCNSNYDIVIKFKNGSLVFNRYPLKKSLILSGLDKFDTELFNIEEMDTVDVYYRLLMQKGISINYLKGINSLFDLFVDPITKEILENMGEPTDVKNLLIRATEMVSTTDYYNTSSMRHHRIRGYERLASVVYNELSREFASYRTNTSPNKSFSINPEAVFQRIVQDSSVQGYDVINPIHNLKTKTLITYGGSGGRLSRAFVTRDRVYAEDSVGIISESTVDSGKVGMNAYLSASPSIKDLRGCVDYNDQAKEPKTSSQTYSVSTNLYPCLTQDDPKRVSFTNIQLSHHVPCDNGDISRIRTGYERTIASNTDGEFCFNAKSSGTVINIDTKTSTMKVRYDEEAVPIDGDLSKDIHLNQVDANTYMSFMSIADASKLVIGNTYKVNSKQVFVVTSISTISKSDIEDSKLAKEFATLSDKLKTDKLSYVIGKIKSNKLPIHEEVFDYSDKYTTAAGYDFKQPFELNVKLDEKFKKGDTLVYNKGFFKPDPYSKRVDWKHGVMATIVLMDVPENEEDGSRISPAFSKEMSMDLVHTRTITLTNTSVVNNIVSLGTKVEPSSKLFDLLDEAVDVFIDDDEDASFFDELGNKYPTAKYNGYVVDIKMYYACDPSELSDSLKSLAKTLFSREKQLAKQYEGADNKNQVKYLHKVKPKEKYQSVDFEKDTVLLEILISDKEGVTQGDKLCIGSANKTVVSDVMDKAPLLEDGREVDILFADSAVFGRVIPSPFLVGWGNIILEETEKTICSMYFD